MLPKLWQGRRIVKSLAFKNIYGDPHKLDSFLDSGKSIEVVRDRRAVAGLVPRKAAAAATGTSPWPPIDFRMREPDAFLSPERSL